MGCQFPLQGIFQTQGSNARLPHRRWILDHWATREAHSVSTLAQPINHPLHAHHSWHDSRNEANEARGRVRCSECSLHCELKLHLPGWRVAANCQKCRNQSHVSETDLFFFKHRNYICSKTAQVWVCVYLTLGSPQFSSVAQSCLTLQLHGLQHARPPCPSPTPGVYSNSCPSSRWCHPTISHPLLCHPLLLLPSIFPSIRVFCSESVLCIRWPKDWSFSFSISPSNEYSGLVSFRMD